MGGCISQPRVASNGIRHRSAEDEKQTNGTITDHKPSQLPEPKPPKLKKKDIMKAVDFMKIDEHARKAPKHLCRSVEDLVAYLGTASKDHLFLVRMFFVWIAKNIRYDTDGFFGRTARSPCDYQSVMVTGKSVCQGYSNVMEEMCKLARIPVKTLSGFAKGIGYSPDNPFTTNTATNHAWNAVFIRGNWFLLDSTWGAGHLGEDREYKAEFDEFYFLTDPDKFAISHFPYTDDSPDQSIKWQLLRKPLSLEKFNSLLYMKPPAFNIGLLPASHKNVMIQFNDEIELTFKEERPKTIKISTKLYREENNVLREEPYCCYGYMFKGLVRIKVKPPKTGTYRLKIFGTNRSSDNDAQLPYLFEYKLHCTVPSKENVPRKFPYPYCYTQAFIDDCLILEPLGKSIPSNSMVKMRFQSPVLSRMMIDNNMMKKQGDIFEGMAASPTRGCHITVYGSRSESGSLAGLYRFCVA